MENSSYSVKPELFSDKREQIAIEFIEEVLSITKINHLITLKTNMGDFFIEMYENKVIRFITALNAFDLNKSFPLEQCIPIQSITMEGDEFRTVFSYEDLTLIIYHNPFLIVIERNHQLKFVQKAFGFSGTQTFLFMDRHVDDFIYGLGEKTGFLNKNNEKTVMWNRDVYEPHTRTNKELYQSINMFAYFSQAITYGFFLDNPSRIVFDFETNVNQSVVISDIGKFDYYIYTGNSLKEIITQHSLITGKTYLPPLWSLGYHQSRHSYESIEKLESIYNHFLEKEIPIDALYLDILYMERYKVFSFNPETYKGYETILPKMRENGLHIVPIVDPGVKVEKGYQTYEEGLEKNLFCKTPNNEPYIGEVWPGPSVFYDFTNSKIRDQWGQNHQFYTQYGIDGIWNDMNEPSVFRSPMNTMSMDVQHDVDGSIKTHREMHNLYGLGMSMATYEGLKSLTKKRPFVLTRAGYAGIQKYAHVWTGDNRSSWEHLEMTLPMCLNLSLSGVALCGPDIGGFSDDTTEELLIRWTQLGTFLPFFRNHSSIGVSNQEPWAFGKRCETITKKFIRLRYELMRYIYNEVYKSHKTGLPIMKPLVLEYEQDPLTYSIHDEYLFGDSLLIAPILRPGETVRKVYLPAGVWYDFFTNKKYEGNQYILAVAQLDEIPVFVKGGSILPMTNWAMNTEQLSHELIFKVYPNGEDISTSVMIDDGYSLSEAYCEIQLFYTSHKLSVVKTGHYDFSFHYKTEIMESSSF